MGRRWNLREEVTEEWANIVQGILGASCILFPCELRGVSFFKSDSF